MQPCANLAKDSPLPLYIAALENFPLLTPLHCPIYFCEIHKAILASPYFLESKNYRPHLIKYLTRYMHVYEDISDKWSHSHSTIIYVN